jgi:hypothetical protein
VFSRALTETSTLIRNIRNYRTRTHIKENRHSILSFILINPSDLVPNLILDFLVPQTPYLQDDPNLFMLRFLAGFHWALTEIESLVNLVSRQ